MNLSPQSPIFVVYLATFFYAVHYAVILYIQSSFLENLVGTKTVGAIFTLSALASIFAYFKSPSLLRRFGNYIFLFAVALVELGSLITLSLSYSKEIVITAFIVHQIALNLLFLSITIFLETLSKDRTTGTNRGIFLTVINTAILTGPFIASYMVSENEYRNAFLWSAVLLLPVILLIGNQFSSFKDPAYDKVSFAKGLGQAISRPNIRRIVSAQFLLEFFYSVMIIYTPIYLHKEIGISINEILGIIMPIALIPFIIFPYILGSNADRRFGEKEFLVAGFIIISIATFYLSFITTKSVIVWAIALFITRIGATFIETMSESYFFKQIDATDAHLISFFRSIRPVTYVIAPLVVSAFLIIFPYQYIFASLGIILIVAGLKTTLYLKDTR